MKTAYLAIAAGLLMITAACSQSEDLPESREQEKQTEKNQQKLSFDVKVTRDGKTIGSERRGITTRSSGVDASDKISTMNPDIPFGLVGIDTKDGRLLIDNEKIKSDASGNWAGYFDSYYWNPEVKIQLSAYYPHVGQVSYGNEYSSYSIPYTVQETEAGPLVSKTVERAINQLNMVPLEFQHITNDIGFKVCDATPDENLQGLIHLRKLTATNVASAGVFVNELGDGRSTWSRQGYYRKVVVFEGDEKVGVGTENEKFVGFDSLVDSMRESHRYYSIPDEIELGKQCVEVVFDVDGFYIGDFYYQPLKEQTVKYMLYGLLPGNEFVYGKQYTFHIGLDLSSVYHEITFSASVGDWETKIYENNDSF